MVLKGNKGEWSEVYVLLKLLGEGQVYAGDQDMNKIKNLFYPIVKIIRNEKDGKYGYAPENKDIIIQTECGSELLRMPASRFLAEAENLLTSINAENGAFAVPETEKFMDSIHCHTLKSKSSDKTDIRIVLHDCRTKINSEMGYSIKSQLGSNSTLLNASKATNFTFTIKGAELSDADISEINNLEPKREKVIKRYNAIREKGGTLVFKNVDNATFRNNLLMLDGCIPKLAANLLLLQLETGKSRLKDLATELNKDNPLGLDTNNNPYSYGYKIKHLLTSTALGMMPATAWNGKFDANGGYIVVKKDGEVLCYHFYDRNIFEDYLYNNAYLERASTTKFEYAKIIKEDDGELSFKLNLQIRLG